MESYASTADELLERVLALAKEKPDEVMALDNPFGLFKLGLKCDDLGPSLFQAQWALARAKQILGARPA